MICVSTANACGSGWTNWERSARCRGAGSCRLALSEEDRLGRERVMGWMQELGLEIHQDAIGNVFGLRPGREPAHR